jgi:hypothetical protein
MGVAMPIVCSTRDDKDESKHYSKGNQQQSELPDEYQLVLVGYSNAVAAGVTAAGGGATAAAANGKPCKD